MGKRQNKTGKYSHRTRAEKREELRKENMYAVKKAIDGKLSKTKKYVKEDEVPESCRGSRPSYVIVDDLGYMKVQ